MKRLTKKSKVIGALAVALHCAAIVGGVTPAKAEAAADDRFSGYEIRVIRPRFMTKTNRIEIGGQLVSIMNNSFIYTYLASGLLNYHFSEAWAIEINGAYGGSIDKQDKTLLQSDFGINTNILRTKYMAAGGLLWTPIYGKTQLPSGEVIYFDTFLTAEAGLTGIEYLYEQCTSPNTVKPPATVKGYPGVIVGFGQKYFINEDTAVRWDVRDNIFIAQVGDGTCTPGVSAGTDMKQNATLQIGMSTFF